MRDKPYTASLVLHTIPIEAHISTYVSKYATGTVLHPTIFLCAGILRDRNVQVANGVTNLEPSALAKRLGISIDDLEGWLKCVREGGSGAVSDNTFVANPAPYNVKIKIKIDLSGLSADNSLNLHYQDNRCDTSPKTIGVSVLFQTASYYFIGTSESCRSISLKAEIEIAR